MLSLSDAERAYHLRQYTDPYKSTIALADFIGRTFERTLRPADVASVMDVGCGAGANLYWLHEWETFPTASFVYLDGDPDLVSTARERCPRQGSSFVHRDFYGALPRVDVCLSIQVLSFIEDWRAALTCLLSASARWCFVSSLFWHGVETHTHAHDVAHSSAHYNVISIEAFEQLARRSGAQSIEWRDVPVPASLYFEPTRLSSRVDDGKVYSGPILMPWRFAALRMA